MNRRTMPLILIATAMLAGCAGGGGTSGAPPAQAGLPASGLLTITGPPSTSSLARRPQFISSATAHAAIFIDSVTTAAGTSTSCSSGCVIPYTTTAGTHTLRAEIDNSSHVVLGEGTTGAQTIVAGSGNNFTMTVNGAAAEFTWIANTGSSPASPAQPTSITANWAVADSSAVVITDAPGSATFDGGTITFGVTVSGLTGSTPTFTPTTLTHPDASGNDYSFTASCNGATGTGTFSVTATSGAGSGDVLPAQLAGLSPAVTYPSSTLSVTPVHTYTCANGVISDSSGNVTLQ
jgi:hypothetical protein